MSKDASGVARRRSADRPSRGAVHNLAMMFDLEVDACPDLRLAEAWWSNVVGINDT